ncbi:MAG: TonB-dependent receptor plug domain-containing protein, partial [Fidelibacterota bacterium]
STFNVDAIKDAEFLAGGFPAEYGERISSVLRITTKEGNKNKFAGKGSISLISSKFMLEGPIPGGSFIIAGRRTYFDQAYKTYQKIRGRKKEFPYFFYDLQGKVNIDFSEKNRLYLSGFLGDDVLNIKFTEQENNEKTEVKLDWSWGNRTTSLLWRYIFNPKLFSEILLARSQFLFDVKLDFFFQGEESSSEGHLGIEDNIVDYTIRHDFSYFYSKNHTLKFGYDVKKMDFKVDIDIDDINLILYREKPTSSAIYLQDKWQINELLFLQPGIRMNYYTLGKRFSLDPRIGLKYRIRPNTAVKAAWGIYHQFLNTANSEEENFTLIDFWFPIDERYLPIKAIHYGLGIEQWLRHDLTLNVELYYKDMRNLLDLNEQGDEYDESDDFLKASGSAKGIEILLKKSGGKIRGWIGYTLASVKKNRSGLIYFPKFDRRHNINSVFEFKITDIWSVGFSWQFGTGFPYTPVLGKYWKYSDTGLIRDNKPMDYEGRIRKSIYGKKNSSRYPIYHRMDLNIKKTYTFKYWKAVPYIQIVNIYNRKNIFFYFWNHEANPSKREEVTMFPFLPTIGIDFSF